jgi:hypothetical protein
VILSAHATHTIYVRPDRSNTDFDLSVYDQNGNLVQWDDAPDADALCQITPRWTGPFRVDSLRSRGKPFSGPARLNTVEERMDLRLTMTGDTGDSELDDLRAWWHREPELRGSIDRSPLPARGNAMGDAIWP